MDSKGFFPTLCQEELKALPVLYKTKKTERKEKNERKWNY